MELSAKIEQTLHGYDEGHRLLASSTKLSSIEQKYLLELSDLSGHLVEGFDEYLTAYPIPNSKKFAFSKTWYAYEMQRPGCVWTHTLLFNHADFPDFYNFQGLLKFLQRPQRGKYEKYNKTLMPDENSNSHQIDFAQIINLDTLSEEIKLLTYANVFHHLYERVNKIILIAENASVYEKFILSVWSQMWNSLRNRFSFCTGSLSNKTIKGEEFTLQVIPPQNLSLFQYEISNTISSERNINKIVFLENNQLRSDFLQLERYRKIYQSFHQLYSNEFQIEEDKLIDFVWHYGKKMQPFRKNFGWLVKFYELINEPNKNLEKIDEITKALATKFPEKSEQPELKLLLFGNPKLFNKSVDILKNSLFIKPLAEEDVLLEYLLITPYLDCIDVKSLKVTERFNSIWKDSATKGHKLLEKAFKSNKLNEIKKEFFKTSAKFITPFQLEKLFELNSVFAESIFNYNPWLAANNLVWGLPPSIQETIFETLLREFQKSKLSKKLLNKWKKIVYSMLDANNDYYASQLFNMFDGELIGWILDWYTKESKNEPIGEWKAILFKSRDLMMEWLSKNEGNIKAKIYIASMLNPTSVTVLNYGSFPWLDLKTINSSDYTSSDWLEINGFLLALGLANTDKYSKDLVSKSFSTIYEAAEKDELSIKVLLNLEDSIPDGGFFFSWDKCRRLEEALIKIIIKGKWGSEFILEVAHTEHILIRLLNRADDYWRARNLLNKLKEKLKAEDLNIKLWQRNVLTFYFDKK